MTFISKAQAAILEELTKGMSPYSPAKYQIGADVSQIHQRLLKSLEYSCKYLGQRLKNCYLELLGSELFLQLLREGTTHTFFNRLSPKSVAKIVVFVCAGKGT